jgi:hypothetical protein
MASLDLEEILHRVMGQWIPQFAARLTQFHSDRDASVCAVGLSVFRAMIMKGGMDAVVDGVREGMM